MNYIMFFIIGLEIKASTLYWKVLIICGVLQTMQILYQLHKATDMNAYKPNKKRR